MVEPISWSVLTSRPTASSGTGRVAPAMVTSVWEPYASWLSTWSRFRLPNDVVPWRIGGMKLLSWPRPDTSG